MKHSLFVLTTAFLLAGGASYAQSDITMYSNGNYIPVGEEAYALPWKPIQEKDITWKKRVWLTIDMNDTKNFSLSNNREIPNNSRLSNILFAGFMSGAYKAYSANDDRFITELSRQEVISKGSLGFNPQHVIKFRIKEDWIFLAAERRMAVRIVGIAPLMEVTATDGTVTEQPMFWLYYPEIRNYMAKQKVYGGTGNWDEYFEGRNFSSHIDKTSLGMQRPAASEQ